MFALVLALGAVGVLLVAIVSTVSVANQPTPVPTLSPAPTLRPAELTATNAAAATANAESRTLSVTLAAMMQVTPGSARPGINSASAVSLPADAEDFSVQNVWVGSVNGTWYSLYAGAEQAHPKEGALLLVTVDRAQVWEERFRVPLSQGALRVTAEQVQRLTLSAPDGTPYYFDVLARRFVGSLVAYADTATPLPSLTPTVPVTPTLTTTP
jgi:hypothetical protein